MKALQVLNDTTARLGHLIHSLGDKIFRTARRHLSVGPLSLEHSVASSDRTSVVQSIYVDVKCPQPTPNPIPSHFPLFAWLPAEIRLNIWYLASLSPRIVELRWSDFEIGFLNRAAPRPPAVLHACRESRAEALKVYLALFGPDSWEEADSYRGCKKTMKIGPPIYINPVNDVLFFRVRTGFYGWQPASEPDQLLFAPRLSRYPVALRATQNMLRKNLQGVKRVAFSCIDVETERYRLRGRGAVDALEMMPDLEELMLVYADSPGRAFDGRGANLFEGVGECVHDEERAVGRRVPMLEDWEEYHEWQEFDRKKPLLTLRHWCSHEDADEKMLSH